MSDIQIAIETTPNPETLKFEIFKLVGETPRPLQIIEEPQDYTSAQETHSSPLASKLFGFSWTSRIFIGPTFITVTKQDWVDWDVLSEPLAGLIREHLERGEPVYKAPQFAASDETAGENENDSPIVKQIKRILNAEIRPVVAMDGGDITFANYQDGTLSIHMKGACAGCPSSTATLKEGIEARFKELMPEIREVVSVS